MTINFSLLTVAHLIIHEVPKRLGQEDQTAQTLSEEESTLGQEIKGMLRDRLMSAAETSPRGFDIERDPASTSPIPKLIQPYLENPGGADFVEMSRTMAKHLFQSQPRISPSGLLLVMGCNIDDLVAVGILKVEKEEGARLFRSEGGKVTFNLEHLRDLVLTPRTKLFKLAIVVPDDGTFRGRACDNQRAYSSYKVLADFFLERFLGCRLAESPSVATKKFYEGTEVFLHDNFQNDPETYSRIYTHLASSLTSERRSLSVKKFAEAFLPSEHRDRYLHFLKDRGVGMGTFDIDLKLVQKRLRLTLYAFKSGTRLIVPSAEVRERISIKKQRTGDVRVEFTDRLLRVKGR
jgi:hypothetical protein